MGEGSEFYQSPLRAEEAGASKILAELIRSHRIG